MQRVSGFCYFVLVIHGFVTEPCYSRPCLVSFSLVCVPCFMWGRGVRIPTVMSCSSFGSRSGFGSVLLWEPAVSSSLRLSFISYMLVFVLWCETEAPRAFKQRRRRNNGPVSAPQAEQKKMQELP